MQLLKIRFITDNSLKDIVKYMRLLGFDVFFDPSLCLQEIISISKTQNRILITKSKKLLRYNKISHVILINHGTITEQITHIIKHLGIRDRIKAFSRCLICNSLIVNVSLKEIEDRIPPKTKEFCDEYTYCRKCDKIYWKGTHYIRMKKVVDEILGD